ncbi:hypothetical protein PRIPAC_77811 [Pristionchus pacificus]|uniref:Uncharacterized protein n=1 Tax=Pristionchus pacificus TaxID=54126 RepID=A0A454XWM4_PRIPA|nr:hypothetical protein PRIPAC_77811 [Pristionchus pacificus]|eukprot:PDM79819.1 hypothetical protein PRIPAC_32398 [Pristionchus pacificus]
MQWTILLTIAAFLCAFELAMAQADGYKCSYDDGHVVERGYPTRPMAADEMQQLGEFRKQWEQFKPQFRLYIKGDVAAMPPIPAVPCFCREPCLGNAIGNTLV